MNTLHNSAVLAVLAGVILAPALGCGDGDGHARQVDALLERIARLDLRAPVDQRARQIERLRALSLTDPALARVRDACALAHAGLLAAESEQAGVRKKLDQAGDAGMTQLELAAIAAAVQQASRRLHDAQNALPECETQTRALLTRRR